MKYFLGCSLGFATAVTIACAALAAHGAENNQLDPAGFTRFASAPLCFEAGAGPEGAAQFIARGAQCSVLLVPGEAEIVVGNGLKSPAFGQVVKSTRSVHLKLVGANPNAKMTGCGQLSAHANYFIGNDPAEWRAGVPLFTRVQVDEIYPGVQVIYYANQSAQLEYDFVLQAGAKPEQIRFGIEGADRVRVDAAGNLVLTMAGAEVCQHAPVVYQKTGGGRKQIPATYHLNRDGTVGLELAGYDKGSPLTIDPVLDFLTYLGSNRTDIGWAIALDSSNNIYVTGETLSKNLQTTNSIVFFQVTNQLTLQGTNRYFTNYQGGSAVFGDAFVASYDTNGALRYLTYLGGKHDDGALGIAVDGSMTNGGEGVWLTGFTDSPDFPITTNAIRSALDGPNNNARHLFPGDAFIAHLDRTGSNLDYSTYFGGSELDEGIGIAVANSNQVYVTGLTTSTNILGITANSYQRTNSQGSMAAFVTELVDGTNRFTTFLGGTNTSYAVSIALDSAQRPWVTGITFATNFPTTNWMVLSNKFESDIDNFLNASNKQSTNLFPFETGHHFADLNNQTNSPNHNTSFRSDGFVSQLSADGSQLLFSIYLGGTNDDAGFRIAIDSSDNVYVTGFTECLDFPTNRVTGLFYPDFPTNTVAFPGATTNFLSHVFVTELTNDASSGDYVIGFSTSFGGNGQDFGRGIAVDTNGNIFVTGSTSSTNFFHTNVVILTTNISFAIETNKHNVVTNYAGIPTNNFTFANLSQTNVIVRLTRTGLNTNDIFVAEIAPGGTNFVNSILLGGPGDDTPNGIAIDPGGTTVYLVGSTTSRTNFATTNAAQPTFGGHNNRLPDAFIGKIQISP